MKTPANVTRAAPKIAARQEAVELEGRLFGGAYAAVLGGPFAPKGSPKYKMIEQGREQYNASRVEAGLPEVSDWRQRPEQLMQRLPSRSDGSLIKGIPAALPGTAQALAFDAYRDASGSF